MSEFYNKQAGSGAWGYATLANYNDIQAAAPMAPVPSGTPSMAMTVVPTFGAPGYDTLMHGMKVPTSGSYFQIQNAYPQKCTGFTSRLCG